MVHGTSHNMTTEERNNRSSVSQTRTSTKRPEDAKSRGLKTARTQVFATSPSVRGSRTRLKSGESERCFSHHSDKPKRVIKYTNDTNQTATNQPKQYLLCNNNMSATASMSLLRQATTTTMTCEKSLAKTMMQRAWSSLTKSSSVLESLQRVASKTPTATTSSSNAWLYSEPHVPGRLGLGLALNRVPGHHPRFTHALSRNVR